MFLHEAKQIVDRKRRRLDKQYKVDTILYQQEYGVYRLSLWTVSRQQTKRMKRRFAGQGAGIAKKLERTFCAAGYPEFKVLYHEED